MGLVSLALVPGTLALAGAILATNDPRFGRQDVYQVKWVLLALLSVPLQWVLLAWMARRPPFDWRAIQQGKKRILGLGFPGIVMMGLVLIGFWLRIRAINTEPLQWDEVENYNVTQGFLKAECLLLSCTRTCRFCISIPVSWNLFPMPWWPWWPITIMSSFACR